MDIRLSEYPQPQRPHHTNAIRFLITTLFCITTTVPPPFSATGIVNIRVYGSWRPLHHRLHFVITSFASIPSTSFSVADNINSSSVNSTSSLSNPYSYFHPQNEQHKKLSTVDAVVDVDSVREFEFSDNPGVIGYDSLDSWKWRLTTLLHSKDKQELVSKEKKDRIIYDQIASLASKLGLHSRLYAKVVVVSKVPLPNYRFDLDDKRPQREVILSPGLHRRVGDRLRTYLSHKTKSMNGSQGKLFPVAIISGNTANNGSLEQKASFPKSKAVSGNEIWRRSMQLSMEQQAWQKSAEGQKMLVFRRSLPAYKVKDAILKYISKNQVVIISGETGCGKTAQVPQFILESEINSLRGATCSIICTQPRRISAMSVLKNIRLIDDKASSYNTHSFDENLVRAVICSGLYPGICSVVYKENSLSLKTMEDGLVLLHSVKVNSVYLQDSTAVSDSMLLLFGGSILKGDVEGHVKMLGGYLEFFMEPAVAIMYQTLKRELDELFQSKLINPKMNLQAHRKLISAIQLLLSGDQCGGRFVYNHQVIHSNLIPSVASPSLPPTLVCEPESGPGGDNSKSQLQTLLARAGYSAPMYRTSSSNNQFMAVCSKESFIRTRKINRQKQKARDPAKAGQPSISKEGLWKETPKKIARENIVATNINLII
ncbi:hypothetical protein E3N88_31550 [Mikania micrantha]|uniref:RNA helicase n=1 Tax=Mikania micrantha TaxID=192012 RepID=A0A5N6MQN7_9ASTR|nr:hypothetical protein E3N88_31550 [Mikania micrantha]